MGNSISDITKTRNEFKQLLGLEEVCVTSFIDKVIKQENYPSRTGEQRLPRWNTHLELEQILSIL